MRGNEFGICNAPALFWPTIATLRIKRGCLSLKDCIADVLKSIKETELAPGSEEDRITDALKVIKETELPPAPHIQGERQRRSSKEGEKEGFTNRGSLQAFDEELQGQSKDDALYWTLFAQLAADAQFDRQTQVGDWYNLYLVTLGKIGMSASGFSFAGVPSSQLEPTAAGTALELIKAFTTPEEFALIQDVINALGSGSANKPLQLFNNEASSSNNGNFQVSTGKTDKYLNLTINIGYFYFNTTQNITNMLFWKWTTNTVTFRKGNNQLSLSRSMADRLRDTLVERLGDRIIKNIEDIPLA